jgi:rfaE bifunctional protein nucleotidyltransferase chain/domain
MIVIDPQELARIVGERQEHGERIVFTNGVFDILHVGHARYLAEARALGDALLVAVNADSSVRQFKGDKRPIVPEAERMELIDALRVVDYVTLFDTRTPVPLIECVRPALYVKGGDYRVDDLPEAPVVRGYGGQVQILSLIMGRSTTNVIANICAAYAPQNESGPDTPVH